MSKRFHSGNPAGGRGGSPAEAHAGAAHAPLTVAEREQVHAQIRERHSKAALQMAKDLHKRCGSEESEALLADAYRARIEDLLKLRMTAEARTLVAIVRERLPRSLARLGAVEQEIALLEGRFDAIVAPLGKADLAAEERERIEAFVRQRVEDLGALAKVSTLAADHPLRVAAGALAAAFEAVTRGPVSAGQVALPEVARRNPLASWKGLIRAIDSYYRGEPEACRRWLETIAADSPPARLVPAIERLCGADAGPLTAAAERLVEMVGDRGAELRRAAQAFDLAVAARKHKPIEEAARKVLEASVYLDAEARERLRQQMAVRLIDLDFSPLRAERVLGAIRRDAYFLRVLALKMEDSDRGNAVLTWEDFREDALRRRWFAAGSVEDGVLALHMAKLVERLTRDAVDDLTYDDGMWKPGLLQKTRTLLSSPEMLFARACEADPSAEAFEAWLNWAKKKAKPKDADAVAERWRKALPKDARPLLYLMESAEERKAYKKSLGYLEEAEKIDGLNPAVRRARLRLLVAAALRHLREKKANLARREIEAIGPLPEGPLRECAILACALDCFRSKVDGDPLQMDAMETVLVQLAGAAGSDLLLHSIFHATGIYPRAELPHCEPRSLPPAELLAQTARICQVGELAGLAVAVRESWPDALMAALRKGASGLEAAQLLALGEAALKDEARELAYAVSASGLAGNSATAHFLFLRARSLPFWAFEQKRGCIAAALTLARAERDTALAEKILNAMHRPTPRSTGWMPYFDIALMARPLASDLLHAILDEERKRNLLPVERKYKRPGYAPQLIAHEEGSTSGLDDAWDEDDEEEDEDDWDQEIDEDEAEAAGGAFDALRRKFKAIFRRMPPESRERILDAFAAGAEDLDQRRHNAKQNEQKTARARRAPAPEQGSLFGEEP
ncbi:MAG: hypothetical protein ACLGP3_12465 [Acidobacteriota bacterium]